MKTKTVRIRTNGKVHSRRELLAAQERALKCTRKMTASEGFESLVRAGIYTRAGKLTPRYGG